MADPASAIEFSQRDSTNLCRIHLEAAAQQAEQEFHPTNWNGTLLLHIDHVPDELEIAKKAQSIMINYRS